MSKKFPSVKSLVINGIRVLLFLAIIASFIYGRDLVLLMSMIGFVVTFVPVISSKVFNVHIPAEFEVIVLMFVYGLFIFSELQGLYSGSFWLGLIINFCEGLLLGIVGLSIIYALEDHELIELTPFVIVVFTFCFSFSIGGLWEVFEYVIDILFGFSLQRGDISSVMLDLMITAVSALTMSIVGLYNLKKGKRFLSSFLSLAVGRSSRLFGLKRDNSYYEGLIERVILAGEGEKVEFKSTLRKNLHTHEIDKRIEHSVLKTVSGFLNAKGGTLLVGVSDSGEVTGLSHDDFPSTDKLKLYVTGLIRSYIGNQYLPYIRFNVHNFKGKEVLLINCKPAAKRVFLKWQQNEEFYVRHGASTLQLSGSALIDYVSQRFN